MPIGGKRSGNRRTPPASVDSIGGSPHISKLRQEGDVYSGSWNAGSWSPHRQGDDEEMADKMSLDDSEGSTDSDSASDMDLEEELNDDTDQEDWANMDPEALRETRCGPRREHRDYNYLSRTQTSNPRYRSISAQAHSLPQPHAGTPTFKYFLTVPNASRGNHVVNAGNSSTSHIFDASTGVAGSGAERDAIEALVAMGSM
ncbi:hypothetical protein CFE70_002388 [Pyrenophora teres f. teres 0-1]